MRTAVLILCAVAAEAAPLAAKSVISAASPPPEVSSYSYLPEETPSSLLEEASLSNELQLDNLELVKSRRLPESPAFTRKLSKAKKFRPAAVAKPAQSLTPPPAPSAAVPSTVVPSVPTTSTVAPQAAVVTSATEVSRSTATSTTLAGDSEEAATSTTTERRRPEIPEEEALRLDRHINAPFVSPFMLEDEKARRFDHSALFGFASFF